MTSPPTDPQHHSKWLADQMMSVIRESKALDQETVERIMVEELTRLGYTVTKNEAGGYEAEVAQEVRQR